MPDIQEQFARFVERWRGYLDCDPAPSNSENFEEELRDFAREVVEECCDCTTMAYEEDAIRRHFPWLEEK